MPVIQAPPQEQLVIGTTVEDIQDPDESEKKKGKE